MLDTRAAALRQTLRGLSTRSAQALQYFALENRPVSECAERFGIPESAFEVMLLRAAEEYTAARDRAGGAPLRRKRRGPTWRFAEESERAQRFRQALEGSAVPAEPTLLALRDAVRELKVEAKRILELDEEAIQLADASPKRRDELWLRRVLVVAVLALTALLYARDRLREKPSTPPAGQRPKTGR